MMVSKNFIDFDFSYQEAKVVFWGLPFDGTSSFRPGSRFAPPEVRKISYSLESYSPYSDKRISDCMVHDAGDLELPVGNTQKVLQFIERKASDFLTDNKKMISCGGEHLVTLPLVKSYLSKYDDLILIQFDAHTDLREESLGERYTHGTVIRRIAELISPARIYQFGIRSGEQDEFEFGYRQTNFHPFGLSDFSSAIKQIPPNAAIYVTLDLDILDPAFCPGTGTPEPGGITFTELLNAVLLLRSHNIVGIDVVELAPDYDSSGISSVAAAKLIRELVMLL